MYLEIINEINGTLERIGSIYRTDDGFTICGYIGHLTFLRRTFSTREECLNFVKCAEEYSRKARAKA